MERAQSNEFKLLLSCTLCHLCFILLSTMASVSINTCRNIVNAGVDHYGHWLVSTWIPGMIFHRPYLISSCWLDNVRSFLPISNLQISNLQLLAWQRCLVQNDCRCGRDNITRYQFIDYSLYMDQWDWHQQTKLANLYYLSFGNAILPMTMNTLKSGANWLRLAPGVSAKRMESQKQAYL